MSKSDILAMENKRVTSVLSINTATVAVARPCFVSENIFQRVFISKYAQSGFSNGSVYTNARVIGLFPLFLITFNHFELTFLSTEYQWLKTTNFDSQIAK